MTFLAPWAFALGLAAAAGALLLHLVARHRPAAYVLPTARFIPERDTIVSRAASRPTDLLLLAIRMLLLIAAGAAFARPVVTPARVPLARIVLLDRSLEVASGSEAVKRAREVDGERAHGGAAGSTLLITFDTAAQAPRPISALDSLGVRGGDTSSVGAAGSVSAALVAARRAAPVLARTADSVELVLVSPVLAGELDAATDSIRAEWPGSIRVERVAGRSPPQVPTIERPVSLDDPLGPSLAAARIASGAGSVRLVRRELTAVDSAFARAGSAVVRWDSTSSAPLHAEGLALGDDVVVAPLGRRALREIGFVRARWADGTPAVREESLGAGCLREVGVELPAAGDIPLRPSFQRIARGLLGPCGETSITTPADSATIAWLTGPAHAAPAAAFGARDSASPLAPWLLGIALLCAVAELIVRGLMRTPAEVIE